MALFIRQDDNRSELQQRIAAELQEKAKLRAGKAERPDGVDDSQFLKGTKTTTSRAWIWIVVIAVVIILAIFVIIQTSA